MAYNSPKAVTNISDPAVTGNLCCFTDITGWEVQDSGISSNNPVFSTPVTTTGRMVAVTNPVSYPYTTLVTDEYISVNTSASRTVSLMASPVTGQRYYIKDVTGNAAGNNISVTPSGKLIDNVASIIINTNFGGVFIVYNGTQWNIIATYRVPRCINIEQVSNINALVSGATQLFTPQNRFYPTSANFTLTAVSALIGVVSLTIGTNASSYNNILGTLALTGLSAVNNTLNVNLTSVISSVAPGTPIFVNVGSIALASTYTIKVALLGYYD